MRAFWFLFNFSFYVFDVENLLLFYVEKWEVQWEQEVASLQKNAKLKHGPVALIKFSGYNYLPVVCCCETCS